MEGGGDSQLASGAAAGAPGAVVVGAGIAPTLCAHINTPPTVTAFRRPVAAAQAPACRRPIRVARRRDDSSPQPVSQCTRGSAGCKLSDGDEQSEESPAKRQRLSESAEDIAPGDVATGGSHDGHDGHDHEAVAPELAPLVTEMCLAFCLAPTPLVVEGELMHMNSVRATRACGL